MAFVAVAAVAYVGCTKEENNGSVDDSTAVDPEPDSIPDGWVDLGLPSGLLWAECNVGAMAPEEYGDYFAWGETQPKSMYVWSTYQHVTGTPYKLTKYCNSSDYGYNGFSDNLTTLDSVDDAATASLGDGARIPTKEEWQELMDNTTAEWTTLNNVNGRKFTAANGNTLFLPAAGYFAVSELSSASTIGSYWSASLFTDNPNCARLFFFKSDRQIIDEDYRYFGLPVRAVRDSQN